VSSSAGLSAQRPQLVNNANRLGTAVGVGDLEPFDTLSASAVAVPGDDAVGLAVVDGVVEDALVVRGNLLAGGVGGGLEDGLVVACGTVSACLC